MPKKQKMTASPTKGEVILYQESNGKTALDVRLEGDTLWLTQKQISELFQTERSVVTKHFGNIFRSGELDKNSVCAKFAHTARDGKTYKTTFYNLDAIISVGYRVNSKRGTQFRIWATDVLHNYILKGYSANKRRLKELKQSLRVVSNVLERYNVNSDQAKALLKVVTDYAYALDLLDDYDHQRISIKQVRKGKIMGLSYEEAQQIILQLRKTFKAPDIFGREKDKSLNSSLHTIMQTFDGRDVYPSLEEKAAHLLYFLVKNHSFVDGNKRIAAALFLWFMEKNNALYNKDRTKRIADNALVAITLMIAESKPSEKDVMVNLIVNLINKHN
jgi:prophage maintenance system killer protein